MKYIGKYLSEEILLTREYTYITFNLINTMKLTLFICVRHSFGPYIKGHQKNKKRRYLIYCA